MTAIRGLYKWMVLLSVSVTGVCFSGIAAAGEDAAADPGASPEAVQEPVQEAVHEEMSDAGRIWTVLIPSEPETAASRARALFDELSLVSMGAQVRAAEVPPHILTDGEENRERLIAETDGGAVLWLSMDAPNLLFVLTPAAEPVDHRLHRIVSDTAASMALAARELLEAPEAQSAPKDENAVTATPSRRQLDDSEIPWEQKPPVRPPPLPYREDLGMAVLLQGGTGFFGGSDADYWTVGTGIFFQWMPKQISLFRLFLSGGIGPTYEADDVSLTDKVTLFGRWLEPGLAVAVAGRLRRVRLGPVFSISGVFTSMKLKHHDVATEDMVVNNWNLKGGLGLALSVPVRAGCRVGLDAGMEALVFRYHYQEARTRQDIFVSPTLTWKTVLTVVFFFPNRRR